MPKQDERQLKKISVVSKAADGSRRQGQVYASYNINEMIIDVEQNSFSRVMFTVGRLR